MTTIRICLLAASAVLGACAASTGPGPETSAAPAETVISEGVADMVRQEGEVETAGKDAEVRCFSVTPTGSHIRARQVCFTKEELEQMRAEQQREADRMRRQGGSAVPAGN